jgi:hypothetical protein
LQAPRAQQAARAQERLPGAGTRIIGQGSGLREAVQAVLTSTRTLATTAGHSTAAPPVGTQVSLLP